MLRCIGKTLLATVATPIPPASALSRISTWDAFRSDQRHVSVDPRGLCSLGLDSQNYGKPNWNPLGGLIKPGETVLLKPNLIAHSHMYTDEWNHVITHGSVIRAVLDYVYIALNGQGKVIIADAPQTDSRMDLIRQRVGIDEIRELYWKEKKFDVAFVDLRDEHWVMKDGVCVETVKLQGDPLGNARVNLAHDSFFSENDGLNKRYYGAFYDVAETNEHHSNGVHEYMISRTALESTSLSIYQN